MRIEDINDISKSRKGEWDMKTQKSKVIKRIMVGGLALVIGIGTFFSYQLGKSVGGGMLEVEKGIDTNYNSVMQLKEWGYDLQIFQSQYKAEEIELMASDGQRIVGYYYTVDGKKDNDTVLMVHGMGGAALCMTPWAEMYLKQGMNVLLIDRRGTGKVEEGQLTYGWDEKKDLTECVDYLRERIGEHKLILHGQSLGGTVVGVYAETEHAQEYVDGFILDCPMKSLKYMLFMEWKPDSKMMQDYAIACGSWYLKVNYGFTFDNIDLLKTQKHNKVPTLLIGATKDDLCTIEDCKEIFEQIAATNKQYYETDSEHIKGYLDYPQEYTQNVMSFIKNS